MRLDTVRAHQSTGSELPRIIKDEFDAFLERGILAHGFPNVYAGVMH